MPNVKFLQQSSSSDPSSQSIWLLHHWYVLIHACELLHLMSPENGQGREPEQNGRVHEELYKTATYTCCTVVTYMCCTVTTYTGKQ